MPPETAEMLLFLYASCGVLLVITLALLVATLFLALQVGRLRRRIVKIEDAFDDVIGYQEPEPPHMRVPYDLGATYETVRREASRYGIGG